MSRKGIKNLKPYIKNNVEMTVEDIAQELNITKTEVETALKGIFYKFRKYIKNNNIKKQDYL
jgi:predicted transcriptional regulator